MTRVLRCPKCANNKTWAVRHGREKVLLAVTYINLEQATSTAIMAATSSSYLYLPISTPLSGRLLTSDCFQHDLGQHLYLQISFVLQLASKAMVAT